MSTATYDQPIIVCQDCDLVVANRPVAIRQQLLCPRCGCLLLQHKVNIINRGLALSLSALILAVPANLLPILVFTKLGQSSADTLVKNVTNLAQQGFGWIAALVTFCSILAPLMEIFLVLMICLLVKRQRFNQPLVIALKWQSHIRQWAMLEVYLLGILVAYIKMLDSGQIEFGLGMLCFLAMFLLTLVNAWLFDTRSIWEQVGKHYDPAA